MALQDRARAHMPNGTPMAWMASDNEQPVYVDRGEGASFTDVDGFVYVDFNASDLAMFCGHAVPEIVRAVQERVALSTQFLLPTEDSIVVAEELTRRYPHQTHWQFTLSATQANTEAIRLARAVTDREVVVLFEGHYHGHFEEGLVDRDASPQHPLQRGLSKGVSGRVRIAQFNDADSLAEALAPGDVALVLTEPVMSNGIHLLAPIDGWHDDLRRLYPRARDLPRPGRNALPRRRRRRRHRPPRSRAGHPHDRQGRRRWHPDGCLRRHARRSHPSSTWSATSRPAAPCSATRCPPRPRARR